MPTKLEEIVDAARARVAASKAARRGDDLDWERHHPRGFRRNLAEVAKSGVAVIAELKKASPSKGLIRADFPVAELACELESAGAAALSVLTEERYFRGSLENLRTASGATVLPCLRNCWRRERTEQTRCFSS
jgi:indole-3-glycerol phosphate synthase